MLSRGCDTTAGWRVLSGIGDRGQPVTLQFLLGYRFDAQATRTGLTSIVSRGCDILPGAARTASLPFYHAGATPERARCGTGLISILSCGCDILPGAARTASLPFYHAGVTPQRLRRGPASFPVYHAGVTPRRARGGTGLISILSCGCDTPARGADRPHFQSITRV
jgi:hypothetical protein